jgi:hypothetical protein
MHVNASKKPRNRWKELQWKERTQHRRTLQYRLFCMGTLVSPDICRRYKHAIGCCQQNTPILQQHISKQKNQNLTTYDIVEVYAHLFLFLEVTCFPSLPTALSITSSHSCIRRLTPLEQNILPLWHWCFSTETYRTVNSRTPAATSQHFLTNLKVGLHKDTGPSDRSEDLASWLEGVGNA